MSKQDQNCKITKYLTKKDLIEVNEAAIREKRRCLYKDFVNSLPEDFIFVVVGFWYNGKNDLRIEITIDFYGKSVFVGVSALRYESLPIAKEYDDGQIEYESSEETEKRRPYPERREWQETLIKKPVRRQDRFREIVLKAYGNQCAVCEINNPKLLRASHIIPVVNGDDDSVNNGICLCANHEISFDTGSLRITPSRTAIFYDTYGSEIKRLEMRLPYAPNHYPSPKNLAKKLKILKLEYSD